MNKAFCFLNASLHHYLTWKFSLQGWCLYRPADLQKWVKTSILAELHGSASSITLISPKQSVLRLGGVGGIRREKKKDPTSWWESDQSRNKQQLCLRENSKKLISYRNIKQTKSSTTVWKTKVLGFADGLGGTGTGGTDREEVFNHFVS